MIANIARRNARGRACWAALRVTSTPVPRLRRRRAHRISASVVADDRLIRAECRALTSEGSEVACVGRNTGKQEGGDWDGNDKLGDCFDGHGGLLLVDIEGPVALLPSQSQRDGLRFIIPQV